jgi:WD40 repeat protein
VLARLDEWLVGADDTRWVFITGGPGMGKSAILAAWLARHETSRALVPSLFRRLRRRLRAGLTRRHVTLAPHHFISRQVDLWTRPEVIAASLAAQIEAAFPALRDPSASPESRLRDLLGRVSNQLTSSQRFVVVVDGLDETRAEAGENPLPRFLPHAVPAGIRFLCSTRPTYPHLSWIEQRSPVRRLDLDSAQWASSNVAVVRGFWRAVGPNYRPPLPSETVDTAIARADGNIFYAVLLHDFLRDLLPEQRHADRIPSGLDALIGELWDRARQQEPVRVGLSVLCAALEAISLDVLGNLVELTGLPVWTYEDKQRFVRDARQLLLEELASWDGVDGYRLRHDWVRDLIARRLDEATMRGHHATLARNLATWPPPAEAAERRYAVRHALAHRLEAGDCMSAGMLATDLSFLEANCRELGVHETEADVTRLAKRCRTSDDDLLGPRMDDIARALARESHWLRAAPEATAALMWNRLRRFGWSVKELDGQLRVPDGASFLRVRHAHTHESPALVRDLAGHTGWVMACAVTPDGRHVVSASEDKTLKVWELATGRALATFEGHTGEVRACAVTPDGRHVVSASQDQTLKIWELATGRALATLEGHTGEVTACVVTPDGRHVVSASMDKMLEVWELATGRALATLAGHTGAVRTCAVTPDGRHVVSASWDQTLKVWELATGRALATLRGHTDWVMACAVTPDGRRVVSASDDHTLKVWELATGRALATLRGHTDYVMACAVTPDSRHVVSASADHTLKVWELSTGSALATLEGHTRGVMACAVTPDGRHVVSASLDQTLKVWELASRRVLATLEGHTGEVRVCAVTPDGCHAVSASLDQTLKVWDLTTGRALATLKGHTGEVRACAVTLDGRHVVSASLDQTLKVWELATGRELATFKGHTHVVTACAVTLDGRHVVSASLDQTLKVWELATGRTRATLAGHTSTVNACAVTPDDQHVVSASEDKTLKVWELATGRALATLVGHTHGVRACAVTPDGCHAVSASLDKTLKVWELATGRALATLTGHTGWVNACAVTPDGRHVVSASEDKTLKVWDLDTYVCRFTHRGDTSYGAIAATATVIVAGDKAGGVWFLDLPA